MFARPGNFCQTDHSKVICDHAVARLISFCLPDSRSENYEERYFEGTRMPGLRWHRISESEATRAARPSNLSGTML
jgi:hypothetical protein